MDLRKIIREQIDKVFEAELADISVGELNKKKVADYWLMSNPETVVDNYRWEMQNDYYLSKEEKEGLADLDINEILG